MTKHQKPKTEKYAQTQKKKNRAHEKKRNGKLCEGKKESRGKKTSLNLWETLAGQNT